MGLKSANDGNSIIFITLHLLICCVVMFHVVLGMTFVSSDQKASAWGQGLYFISVPLL